MNNFENLPAARPDQALPAFPMPAFAAPGASNEGEESVLSTYFLLFYRRKWLILACAMIGLLIGVAITVTTVRLYRATASIQIDREAPRVVEQRGVEPVNQAGGYEFYQTQYGILKSRSLSEDVVRRLRLAHNDKLIYGYSGRAPAADGDAATAARRLQGREQAAAAIVNANTIVTPVRNSGLVEISFSSPDPKLSADVANAITTAFIDRNIQRRFDATSYARQLLERQLELMRQRLEQSERKLVQYANAQGLITLDRQDAQGKSTGESLAAVDLEALNRELATARAERIAIEARSRGGGGSSAGLAKSLSDPAIAQLRQTRAQLSADLAKLLVQFKPDYPPARALQQQINEIDSQLRAQQSIVTGSVSADYRAALQRERQLQARVNALKGDVLSFRDRSIQYNILQREADTNREQYQALLQRYKEVGIAGSVGVNNVSVVDAALAPGGPYTPRPALNIGLGLVLGALIGAVIAFLLAQLDETVGAPHEARSKLGLPLLGSVPRLVGSPDMVLELEDRRSPVAEAYNSIQTSLRFATSHGTPETLLVTSARPAEGKSTSAVALAQNLARLGKRVILLDGDMRNPSLHRTLGLANTRGLSNALSGFDDLDSLYHLLEGTTLAVMTSGPLPPSPAELLAGPRCQEVLMRLREKFDHVVIDGPPVLGLADSPLMSSIVEATVFVVAANETRMRAVHIALSRLRDARAHLIGVILTKFDAEQIGYDYGYSYEYGRSSNNRIEDRRADA